MRRSNASLLASELSANPLGERAGRGLAAKLQACGADHTPFDTRPCVYQLVVLQSLDGKEVS